jgi:hypothetical protein
VTARLQSPKQNSTVKDVPQAQTAEAEDGRFGADELRLELAGRVERELEGRVEEEQAEWHE